LRIMKRHACCQYVTTEKYKVENQHLIGSKPKTLTDLLGFDRGRLTNPMRKKKNSDH
jgi:hypothetical protein